MQLSRRQHIAAFIVITTLTFGLSLRNDFVWDDHGLIVSNEWLATPGDWTRALFSNFWKLGENIQDPSRSFYRPIVSLSYMADRTLWGLNPMGFHLTNLCLHLLCVMLSYRLATRLLGSALTGFLAATLFAVHPVHVESVSWISGRTDLFCALFYFAAIDQFLSWTERPMRRFLIIGGLSYGLSLLSKEMAITLPLILMLMALWPWTSTPGGHPSSLARAEPQTVETTRPRRSSYIWPLVISGIITVLYCQLRVAILGGLTAPVGGATLEQRLASIPGVFLHYVKLLFLLEPMDPHHASPFARGYISPEFIISLTLCLLFALLLWRTYKTYVMPAFGLCWLVVTLLPTFNLGSFGDVLYADRFLYIPSFGMTLLLAHLVGHWAQDIVEKTPIFRVARRLVLTLIVVSMMLYSASYTMVWRDNLSLFNFAAQSSPKSAYIQFNLANSLYAAGKLEAAVTAYRTALQLEPKYIEARTNLGITLADMGSLDEALQQLQQAEQDGDHSATLYSNLGRLLRRTGKLDGALYYYERALFIQPSVSVQNNLAECLMATNRWADAEDLLRKTWQEDKRVEVANNIGLTLIEQHRPGEALDFLQSAVDLLGADTGYLAVLVHYNRARALDALGRHGEAIMAARKVLQLISIPDGKPGLPSQQMDWLKRLVQGPMTSSFK